MHCRSVSGEGRSAGVRLPTLTAGGEFFCSLVVRRGWKWAESGRKCREGRQGTDILSEPPDPVLSTSPVGLGDGSVSGTTRGLIVEASDMLRSRLLSQILNPHRPKKDRHAVAWRQQDKLSSAWLLSLPGGGEHLTKLRSQPIFLPGSTIFPKSGSTPAPAPENHRFFKIACGVLNQMPSSGEHTVVYNLRATFNRFLKILLAQSGHIIGPIFNLYWGL